MLPEARGLGYCHVAQGKSIGRGRVRTTDLPVAPFRCLTAMPAEGSRRDGILPGYPNLDRGSRVAEVGFEQQTFGSTLEINLQEPMPSQHMCFFYSHPEAIKTSFSF
ncbi:hypothetical protein T265_09185 [Opisthorchis viverrini]|uniref:Uncharacterized protein n=1 Tax=Opisthorchis viverrini TaxID=6198 RepID=A0A075A5S5_OPIVI|nr:hypothetical protein T265_09185 [Opisthorchis viverrini]KER22779.1 hypothetical protein T265_09185 [Opisthorchis viverrini]